MFLNETHLIYRGVIKNGIRQYYRPALHQKQMEALEGKEFAEILFEPDEPVSGEAHGYYRGCIIRKVCMHCGLFEGWDPEEIHCFFTNQFLDIPVVKEIDGKEVTVMRSVSTGNIGKRRMNEFVERVIRYLNERGIEVPESSDWLLNKYQSTHGKTHQSNPKQP